MKIKSTRNVSKYGYKLYQLVCISMAILLVGKCLREYFLDLDVSRVENEDFHSTTDASHPSISLCFGDGLIEKNLNTFGASKT